MDLSMTLLNSIVKNHILPNYKAITEHENFITDSAEIGVEDQAKNETL